MLLLLVKKGSNVLCPGALPLASAGVGGYILYTVVSYILHNSIQDSFLELLVSHLTCRAHKALHKSIVEQQDAEPGQTRAEGGDKSNSGPEQALTPVSPKCPYQKQKLSECCSFFE